MMQMVKASVTPSGSAGAAEASVTFTPTYYGKLYAVYLNYASGVTSVTNVDVKLADPDVALFTKNDNATDGWWFPRWKPKSSTGATWTVETAADGQKPPVFGSLILNVTSSSPTTDAVTAYVYIDEAAVS